MDGFRLGPLAPAHRAVVDGDTRSAAIAAASIVAKVTRDRIMHRLDSAVSALRVLPPRGLHHARPLGRRARPRSVRSAPTLVCGQVLRDRLGARRGVNAGERRALWHYRLRGYRILGTNVRAGRNELDLIVRRGRALTFVEVKQRRGSGFGGALGAVDAEKRRRVRAGGTGVAVAQPAAPERPGRVRGGRRSRVARSSGARPRSRTINPRTTEAYFP